ncbi:MAG TPA: PAS domain-containing protein [Gemmatimonadaceae bacterium]
MTNPSDSSPEELVRLRGCLNDVVSVMGLPAVWGGTEPPQILATLMDALFGMLRLTFVVIRLSDPDGGPPIELMRIASPFEGTLRAQDLTDALGVPSPGRDRPPEWLPRSELRIGDAHIRVTSVPLGVIGESGFVIAGSQRDDFPAETEAVVLQVAVNEAAMGLQQARLLSMQKRIAADLDARVAQRTAELAAANRELTVEVAERRRAEAELREGQRESRLTIDTIPALVWAARPDGTAEFFNRHYLEFIGLSAEQAAGWGWTAAVHPADVDHLAVGWRRIMASEDSGAVEARLRRFDGSYRWFLFRANPLRDDSGAIVKWYGTNFDIEDRKRAEGAIETRERELRQMTETIPEMLWSATPDGAIDYCNLRFLEYTGISAQDVTGAGWQKTIHPEDAARAAPIWSACIAAGITYRVEVRTRRITDHAYRWCVVTALPLRDERGRILKWHGSVIDVHDWKQAQEELRRSEALLADAQRISATGSFSWRVDTDDITFSDELYRIFELGAGSAISLEQIGARVHPDDRPMLSQFIAQARGSAGTLAYELRLLMPDGRIKYTRTHGNVVHHPNAPRECVGAMQDVTQRHLSDRALDQARSDLARVTRSITVGALTASIAHEVNQPLSGIITNAGTCVRLLTADPPNVNGALDTARRTIRDGNRAADVIARLRTLFTNRAVTAEVLDLNDAAQEVVSLLSNDLQRNRVVLRTELDGDPLLVAGDRVQLQQVILNLMRNASDAMTDVEDRPRHLVIRTERDDPDRVRLTVEDVGTGLDPVAAGRLFDAFYTTKRDGMGIGLSVSRTIIERHGGRLWAASNEGPGATFAFSIPCQPDDGFARVG